MVYCGLDVAMVSSYLHVSDEKGKRLVSGPVATESGALRQRLGRFVPEGLKVAIEAGNQTAWLHEALSEMGAEVTVVNPTRVKLIAESRRKTDKIDAKLLCELRAVWVQIAHRVAHDERLDAGPLRDWFWRVAGRRGKKTATVALTRKLLSIAYHLLKYQKDYDPSSLRKAA